MGLFMFYLQLCWLKMDIGLVSFKLFIMFIVKYKIINIILTVENLWSKVDKLK